MSELPALSSIVTSEDYKRHIQEHQAGLQQAFARCNELLSELHTTPTEQLPERSLVQAGP